MADKVIITPKQSVPPLSNGAIRGIGEEANPLESALFNRTWWLFFKDLAASVGSGAGSSDSGVDVNDVTVEY